MDFASENCHIDFFLILANGGQELHRAKVAWIVFRRACRTSYHRIVRCVNCDVRSHREGDNVHEEWPPRSAECDESVMLPSTGYFKTINCPFYDGGSCDRPYCHFKHARRGKGHSQCSHGLLGGMWSQGRLTQSGQGSLMQAFRLNRANFKESPAGWPCFMSSYNCLSEILT